MEASQEVGLPQEPDKDEVEADSTASAEPKPQQDVIEFPIEEWNKIHNEYNKMVDEIDDLKYALKVLWVDLRNYVDLHEMGRVSFTYIKEKRAKLKVLLDKYSILIIDLQYEKNRELQGHKEKREKI